MTANSNQLVFDLKKFAKKNLLTSFIIFRVWSAWKIANIQFYFLNKAIRQRLLTLINRYLQVKRVELLGTKKQNVLEVVYEMFNYWTSDGGKIENLSLPRFTFQQISIFYA